MLFHRTRNLQHRMKPCSMTQLQLQGSIRDRVRYNQIEVGTGYLPIPRREITSGPGRHPQANRELRLNKPSS